MQLLLLQITPSNVQFQAHFLSDKCILYTFWILKVSFTDVTKLEHPYFST